MAIYTGEMGRRIYVITSFDMSSNTSLEIVFKAPSGTISTKTATIGGALSNITLLDGTSVTSVAANESMYWDVDDSAFFAEAGTWQMQGKYTNTGANPDDVFYGAAISFTVTARLT